MTNPAGRKLIFDSQQHPVWGVAIDRYIDKKDACLAGLAQMIANKKIGYQNGEFTDKIENPLIRLPERQRQAKINRTIQQIQTQLITTIRVSLEEAGITKADLKNIIQQLEHKIENETSPGLELGHLEKLLGKIQNQQVRSQQAKENKPLARLNYTEAARIETEELAPLIQAGDNILQEFDRAINHGKNLIDEAGFTTDTAFLKSQVSQITPVLDRMHACLTIRRDLDHLQTFLDFCITDASLLPLLQDLVTNKTTSGMTDVNDLFCRWGHCLAQLSPYVNNTLPMVQKKDRLVREADRLMEKKTQPEQAFVPITLELCNAFILAGEGQPLTTLPTLPSQPSQPAPATPPRPKPKSVANLQAAASSPLTRSPLKHAPISLSPKNESGRETIIRTQKDLAWNDALETLREEDTEACQNIEKMLRKEKIGYSISKGEFGQQYPNTLSDLQDENDQKIAAGQIRIKHLKVRLEKMVADLTQNQVFEVAQSIKVFDFLKAKVDRLQPEKLEDSFPETLVKFQDKISFQTFKSEDEKKVSAVRKLNLKKPPAATAPVAAPAAPAQPLAAATAAAKSPVATTVAPPVALSPAPAIAAPAAAANPPAVAPVAAPVAVAQPPAVAPVAAPVAVAQPPAVAPVAAPVAVAQPPVAAPLVAPIAVAKPQAEAPVAVPVAVAQPPAAVPVAAPIAVAKPPAAAPVVAPVAVAQPPAAVPVAAPIAVAKPPAVAPVAAPVAAANAALPKNPAIAAPAVQPPERPAILKAAAPQPAALKEAVKLAEAKKENVFVKLLFAPFRMISWIFRSILGLFKKT